MRMLIMEGKITSIGGAVVQDPYGEIVEDYNTGSRRIGWYADGSKVLAGYAAVGDANVDGEFNTTDISLLVAAGKYRTGESAEWAEGDVNWDGLFNSTDIGEMVTQSLVTGLYRSGPYAASSEPDPEVEGEIIASYNSQTGEISIQVPEGMTISSLSIRSAGNFLTGDDAPSFMSQDALFSADDDSEIFSGLVPLSLSEDFSLGNIVGVPGPSDPYGDLTIEYNGTQYAALAVVPEPGTMFLLGISSLALIRRRRK